MIKIFYLFMLFLFQSLNWSHCAFLMCNMCRMTRGKAPGLRGCTWEGYKSYFPQAESELGFCSAPMICFMILHQLLAACFNLNSLCCLVRNDGVHLQLLSSS